MYRRILEKDARQVTSANDLAWLLALKGGHAEEAVKLVSCAVEVGGPNPDLLDTRAVAYLALNRPEATKLAVKDLNDVIREAPSPIAYFHQAQAYLLAGDRREALQAWKKANEGTRLTPESVHPLLSRPPSNGLLRISVRRRDGLCRSCPKTGKSIPPLRCIAPMSDAP